MALSAGTRLGPYEIVALRGAGGMGEVYRARDTRLDRTVAIKILPSADPELRARFEREGKAIAALTHPHICTLFDVGHQDGTDYLVMEYLEGETLADKLRRGPLKVDDAFNVAIEIADALDKAHRAGIVHRDLKPANIMLTKSGAKLLDFGLAKPRAAFLTGALRETMTRDQLSGTGTIAGTLHYMAPEQVEGRDADARTDIWGFGCVLYEMITGRKQFAGATPTAVLAMILERDPPPPSTLQPLAAGMDRVVRKCVSRDPDARWQSASDLRDELTWIAGGGASVIVRDASRRQRWSLLLAGALSGVAPVALAILIARPWSAPSAQTEVTRLELTLPRLSSDESAVLSPDGRHLAFIAPNLQGQPMVWVRRLAETTARPLPGTEGAHAASPPFWAPDGHALAFVAVRKLKTIELAGGQPVTVADVPGELLGGSWSTDGTMIVGTYQASKTHGVHRVAAAGGSLVPFVPLQPGALLHALPRFLPDGRRFLYMSWGFDEDHRELCVASLDDPIGRCLGIKINFWGGVSRDGYLVYSRTDTLFAQAFDIGALRPIGEPVIVAERIAHDAFGKTSLSIADATALVYQTARPEVRQLVKVDRSGKRLSVVSEPGTYEGFDVSPDGKQLVAERTEPDGTGLWLIDVARGVSTKVVSAPAGGAQSSSNRVFAPVFSADGQHFCYQTRRGGRAVILEQPTRGGTDRVLYEYSGEGVLYLADVSDDGRWLAIGLAETGRRSAAVVPRSGGKPIVFAEGAGVGLPTPRLSADGRWVAYSAGETGRSEVYVSPLPPTGEKWRVSTAGGAQPEWRSDGLELFYLSPDGSLMATPIRGGKTFDAGTPRSLFATTSLQSGFHARRYAPAADGQHFLLNVLREGDNAATTSTLQFVLNWTAALKK